MKTKTKYTQANLEYFSDTGYINLKPGKHYSTIRNKAIEDMGGDLSKMKEPGYSDDLCHIDEVYDLCALINDLASMLLEEREKRKDLKKELTSDLKRYIREVKRF